jgi:signal transduction histidine kinase/DNA-binding response OmpR family regulator/HAMP domain-containing protein
VSGVAGTWKDLTDSVNLMAGNLTSQVRNIADVTKAVAKGDLSKKITVNVKGEILELKNTVNTMVDQLNSFASEVTRVAREVGTEGKLGGQAEVSGVAGTWKDLTDSVNLMAGNLTSQVRNIAAVTTAVATGDLSKKITVDVKGEILELKNTVNTMVDQLNSFASEVTRVAREVGTEGKLGGQAAVSGVAGTWKDLTDNVNLMAGNLTSQVRNIARVVTAVANGDLKRKLTVEAKGEIAALADTINGMTDTLAIFADQVTTVAREVGVEGQLGGQASVPGAAGTWKDLTENVNQLAANLTTQVRAIADVATAVTKGDLTRSIQVEALGEVAALKDNINEMIRNLKDTTLKNSEQDWLKTNLAKFSRMLQGQKDMLTVGKLILSELAPVVTAQQAAFYIVDGGDEPKLNLLASYAHTGPLDAEVRFGQGLVGQCAIEKQRILLTNVPQGYIKVGSALGEATANNVLVLPVLFEDQVKGILELASFERFSPAHEVFLGQLMESIGIVLNTIAANTRTETLLEQSQSLANELQIQQQELQKTNVELKEKAKLLADQNVEVERKNQEVEQARKALEEKATQLALTSKYKSEFLANMSHELRTPLNSLLILSDQLSRNAEGNLMPKQVEFSRTIHDSGKDLLALINDILDLSKIESGTVTVEVDEVPLEDIQSFVERTFRHVAEARGLAFDFQLDPTLPRTMQTDTKRLQQVLKNLLSNAFKFTEKGSVTVRVGPASAGWSPQNEVLNRARSVLAFTVSDTGIGIPSEKQQIIFEAFQQADGSTSRRYGGTGLGLAISREIARLLGGEIGLDSQPGQGSTFVLYLPRIYAASRLARREPALDARRPAGAPGIEDLAVDDQLPLPEPTLLREQVPDDRGNLQPGDRTVLIVDNDRAFAAFMLELAHDQGFKGLVTPQGSAAIALAQEYRIDAVTLDIRLPDMDGWRVLKHLKRDLNTRHIPVHVISTEEESARGKQFGAMSALVKPVSREQLESLFEEIRRFSSRRERRLLLVEDDEVQRNRLVEALDGGDVRTTAVGLGSQALDLLERERFDCMVLDLGLPDMAGTSLLEKLEKQPESSKPPVIVYTARDLKAKERTQLRRLAHSVIVKQGGGSLERLVDEAALCMHRVHKDLPPEQRQIVEQLHRPQRTLEGKRVLVVDDDIRNIFAMTSVLERQGMQVVSVETGQAAIEVLRSGRDIDVVLMDVMMPGMDGHDTTRAIRKLTKFKSLPIIALTAKAMKGDREKCIEAGASDYIAKPVEIEQLLSLLWVWV